MPVQPWPEPSICSCCHSIDTYWKERISTMSTTTSSSTSEELTDLFCYRCAMQETLWVCMTCGFIGCGRYTGEHAAMHYNDTGHPYSLELATLRIWDYVLSEFVHRVDLLDCPSSPPRLASLRTAINDSIQSTATSSSSTAV